MKVLSEIVFHGGRTAMAAPQRSQWMGRAGAARCGIVGGWVLAIAALLLLRSPGPIAQTAVQETPLPSYPSEGEVVDLNVGREYVAVQVNYVKPDATYGVERDKQFLNLELRVSTVMPRNDGVLALMSVNPAANKRFIVQGDKVRLYTPPPTPTPTPEPTPERAHGVYTGSGFSSSGRIAAPPAAGGTQPVGPNSFGPGPAANSPSDSGSPLANPFGSGPLPGAAPGAVPGTAPGASAPPGGAAPGAPSPFGGSAPGATTDPVAGGPGAPSPFGGSVPGASPGAAAGGPTAAYPFGGGAAGAGAGVAPAPGAALNAPSPFGGPGAAAAPGAPGTGPGVAPGAVPGAAPGAPSPWRAWPPRWPPEASRPRRRTSIPWEPCCTSC